MRRKEIKAKANMCASEIYQYKWCHVLSTGDKSIFIFIF